MKSIIPTRVAEMLFALAIGTFGVLHFMHTDMMAGGVPTYMPGEGKIWVYVTGAGLILAALAILINSIKPAVTKTFFIFIILIFDIPCSRTATYLHSR